ncbi:MAG: endosialidase [Lachnospirales bacterium]
MSIIENVIRINDNNTLSFGNYIVKEKQKVSDFKFDNDLYKCKTHNEVTRVEKNDYLIFESVPGSTVHNFMANEDELTFSIEGHGDTKVTVELVENEKYNITIDGENLGVEKTNLSGKLSFSCDLLNTPIDIVITKK